MNKPILLLKRDLIKHISQAIERIDRVCSRDTSNDDDIILEGLFTLAVSTFENSLIDTLRVLMINIPEKLKIKSENISKSQLIDGDPLRQAIENVLQGVSYKALKEILDYFIDTTGINKSDIVKNSIDDLLEIKATRNILMHNNLIVNEIYKQTAGAKIRSSKNRGGKLTIDQSYLNNSLNTLKAVLSNFQSELSTKYEEYTRIRAIKELFDYIFNTPVMTFDNEFEVDEENDVISGLKETSRNNLLSSSERFYYDIWISHSHGITFRFDYSFFSISDKDKFAFFIKNIDLLKS